VPAARTLPNAENCSLAELDSAMNCTPHKRSAMKMLAIKTLIFGVDFDTVCRIHDVCERTLARWVEAFNRRGVDGLIEAPRSGRPRAIDGEEVDILTDFLDDPEVCEETHWTGRKFHGFVRDDLGYEVAYSTLMRYLKEKNYRLLVPRPWPDRQDETARKDFCERLRTLLADEGVDVWFADESGVEGDPRPRRRWARKGDRLRQTRNGDHIRINVTGMICPRTGEAYLLEFSHSDTDTFQAFLDNANGDLELPRQRNVLICDNASWHKGKHIDWGRFEPLFLPPYSPDLNPIERLWLVMKGNWFTNFIAKDRDALTERLDQALNWLIGRSNENKKTCAIKTEL
jgi:transposase